jgi:LPXTG-motif cell wall-anchored protein
VSGLEGPGLVAGGLALLGLAVVVRKRRDDGIDHVNRRA